MYPGYERVVRALAQEFPEAFEEAMRDERVKAMKETLLFLTESDPQEAVRVMARFPELRGERGLVMGMVDRIAASDPRLASALVASCRDSLSPVEYDALLVASAGSIAQSSPIGALGLFEQISSLEGKGSALVAISRAWSESDPAAALSWLDSKLESGVSVETLREAYAEILLVQAARDPVSTARLLDDMEAPQLKRSIAPEVAAALAKTDARAALLWASGIEDYDTMVAGVERVIDAQLAERPEAVLELLRRNEGGLAENDQLAYFALSSLAAQDAELVAGRFAVLPQEVQPLAAEVVALALLESGGARSSALDWVNELPSGPAFDRAAAGLALNLVSDSPREASQLVGRIGSEGQRSSAVVDLAKAVRIESLFELEEAVSALALDAESKERFGRVVAARLGEELSPLYR